MKLIRAITKIFLFFIALISLGCFRKKSKSNLESWLQINYSDKYIILDTRSVNVLKSLSFRSKKSIVADASDSLLQVEIPWYKDSEINIPKATFDTMVLSAKEKLKDSRALYAVLQSKGLIKTACGILGHSAYILSFNGYDPSSRNKILDQLKECISLWTEGNKYEINIHLMDTDSYQKEFDSIVPLSLFLREDIYMDRRTILSISLKSTLDFDSIKLKKKWKIHTESDQIGKWISQALPGAEAWAKSQQHEPFRIIDQNEYSILSSDLSLKIKYPYRFERENQISGFITVIFNIDTEKIADMTLVKASTEDKEFWSALPNDTAK